MKPVLALCLLELLYRLWLELLQGRASGHLSRSAPLRLGMPVLWGGLGFWALHAPWGWLAGGGIILLENALPPPVREMCLPETLPHVEAHERGHRVLGHWRSRWLAAGVAWSGVLGCLVLLPWTYFLWFGLRTLFFWSAPLRNGWLWRQELAADRFARMECGMERTKDALELLGVNQPVHHRLFARQYSAHPPPALRLTGL